MLFDYPKNKNPTRFTPWQKEIRVEEKSSQGRENILSRVAVEPEATRTEISFNIIVSAHNPLTGPAEQKWEELKDKSDKLRRILGKFLCFNVVLFS